MITYSIFIDDCVILDINTVVGVQVEMWRVECSPVASWEFGHILTNTFSVLLLSGCFHIVRMEESEEVQNTVAGRISQSEPDSQVF